MTEALKHGWSGGAFLIDEDVRCDHVSVAPWPPAFAKIDTVLFFLPGNILEAFETHYLLLILMLLHSRDPRQSWHFALMHFFLKDLWCFATKRQKTSCQILQFLRCLYFEFGKVREELFSMISKLKGVILTSQFFKFGRQISQLGHRIIVKESQNVPKVVSMFTKSLQTSLSAHKTNLWQIWESDIPCRSMLKSNSTGFCNRWRPVLFSFFV